MMTIFKSAILFAHHGSFTLMDRFVMMGEESALFLYLQVDLFLSSQTNWRNIVQITQLNMRRFYLASIWLRDFAIHGREAC